MITLLSGGGPSFAVEGYYVIDFIIYVGLLVFFLRKPLAAFVTERRARIMHDIEEARKLREEAEAKLNDYQNRLDNLEAEIKGILDEARKAGEDQRKRILIDAAKSAERMREDARARLEQETRKLQQELRIKTVELAVQVAETAIVKDISNTHRKRFVDEYITDLESRQGEL